MLGVLLRKKQEIDKTIDKLKADNLEIYNRILSYRFPRGKYKDKFIEEVILKDGSYVSYWFHENKLELRTRINLINTLINLASHHKLKQHAEAEIEYERKRAEKLGDEYQLDYECRHNRNLRDFGM